MSDFLDQYAAQFRAAAEAEARRGRGRAVLVAPLLIAGLAAGAITMGVLLNHVEKGVRVIENPLPPMSDGGYVKQRVLLGVLRRKTEADRDPQVRQTVRDFRDERARNGRLLGKAPSGSAFVLVATRRYPDARFGRGAPVPGRLDRPVRWRRDGLCLMRRGTQGGAGHCVGTAGLRAGHLRGAIAGQAYGVVPDGVTHVRVPDREEPVPVRRNFYVYRVHGNPGPAPIWLDAKGQEVPKLLPYVNRRGSGSLLHLRGNVVVVGFWASWCTPCGPHLRELQTVHERTSDSRVVVTAVATSDTVDEARKVLARRPVGFPVFDDPEAELARRYGAADRFPTTVVLNREGEAVEYFSGRVTADRIEAAVNRAR